MIILQSRLIFWRSKARIKAIMRRTTVRDNASNAPKTVVNGDLKLDCDSRRVYIAGKGGST